MDPHIFADPDPGSQNLADPMDPDPKHCNKHHPRTWDFGRGLLGNRKH